MQGTYRELIAWQKAMQLAEAVYGVTQAFPKDETFGLRSQIRRAAVAIPSNIAEGKASGQGNYRRHVKSALGSEAELQTQIELARRLRLLSPEDANAILGLTSEVGRILVGLLRRLEAQPEDPPTR